MQKPLMIIYMVCLLNVPVLAQAQTDNLFDLFLGKGNREISLDRLSVSQMEMMPDSPRNDQPATFRAIIANDSRYEVKIALAVVDNDMVISQLHEVSLRPGNTQVDFPPTSIQFPRGEQRCFTIQTNVDRKWVPITMARAFCAEGSRARRDRGVELSVAGLRMTPDPASPGQEVGFEVRIRNDGQQVKGNIRIQDRDQVVVQSAMVNIPQGVTRFDLPRTRYSIQRMDTCFTVIVEVDRARHQIDAEEEFCANPTAWTLKSRQRAYKQDRNVNRGN